MRLNPEELQVTSFEPAARLTAAPASITAPEPDCYSPYCYPTQLPEQCPDTDTCTAAA
jgi:hypothetical protein